MGLGCLVPGIGCVTGARCLSGLQPQVAAVCFCKVLFQRAGAAWELPRCLVPRAGAVPPPPVLPQLFPGHGTALVLVPGMPRRVGKLLGAALCSAQGWLGPCSSPEPSLSHLVPIIRRVHQPRLTRSFTGVARLTIHTLTKVGKMISWLSIKQHTVSAVPGGGEAAGAADV